MSTRQVHDVTARRYPDRADRCINTTSSLLAVLVERGWVVGSKRGSRWRWAPAVSRAESMRQLAWQAVAEFSENPRDAWFLVHAALGAVLPRPVTVRPPRAA